MCLFAISSCSDSIDNIIIDEDRVDDDTEVVIDDNFETNSRDSVFSNAITIRSRLQAEYLYPQAEALRAEAISTDYIQERHIKRYGSYNFYNKFYADNYRNIFRRAGRTALINTFFRLIVESYSGMEWLFIFFR